MGSGHNSIEIFYNRPRRKFYFGYLSPFGYEKENVIKIIVH